MKVLVKKEKKEQLLNMWSVSSKSIPKGPKEGVSKSQADQLPVYATEALLLVDWHVANHLIKFSKVSRDE